MRGGLFSPSVTAFGPVACGFSSSNSEAQQVQVLLGGLVSHKRLGCIGRRSAPSFHRGLPHQRPTRRPWA